MRGIISPTYLSNRLEIGLRRLLEACQVLEKVALKHSSTSTKYELEGSYNDPVHEHLSFLIAAKLPRECNEVPVYVRIRTRSALIVN